MARQIRLTLCASVLALLAGCASPMMASGGPGATQQTAVGPVFVDGAGMTLYTFDEDVDGKSNCSALCAEFWPPVMADASAQPSGDFGLVPRGSGKQWAYKGKPLYTYHDDTKPGDITGDGEDGVWHVAKP